MTRLGKSGALGAVICAGLLAGAAAAPTIQPGQWDSESRTVDFDMALPAGMPAAAAEQVKRQMLSQTHKGSQCITRAQIENAPEEMMAQSDGECEYTRFSMENGTLDAAATCNSMGSVMNMEMTGTYTAASYSSRMTMTGDGPMGAMTVIAETKGKRVGDCR